jgi:uncharacterized OB-fold protein
LTVAGPARFDLPTPDQSTEAFWSGTREGRLRIKRCQACRRAHFYPRPFCPHCWSEDVVWEDATGKATLYTYSVVYQNDLPPFPERVPYVAAVVELEEGPRLMTNVVDCPFDQLQVGMDLVVAYRQETDEITLPVFRPPASVSGTRS